MKRSALMIVFAATALLWPAGGQVAHASPKVAQLITFTNDSTGAKPNGWKSVDSNIASFRDSLGADLEVNDFGSQSKGNALAVNPDDQSFLEMTFSVPVCGLRLAFGNDDPTASNPGDKALLRVANGPVTVGKRAVVMNRNDIMDQSIGFTGASFTNAAFWYAVTTSGLIEVVDDIAIVLC